MQSIHVRLKHGYAITEDEQVLPVTHMYDEDGEVTKDPDAALACVVGPDKEGFYLTVALVGKHEDTVH